MPQQVSFQVLPSPLICTEDVLEWQPFKITWEGETIVYKPFASGKANLSIHPPIDFEKAFSQISGSGNVKFKQYSRLLPVLSDDPNDAGKYMTLPKDYGDKPYSGLYPIDTISIEADEKNLEKYKEHFFRNIRQATRQIWVGRSASYIDPPSMFHISLREDRSVSGDTVQTFGPMTILERGPIACSEKIWRECWLKAVELQDIGTDAIVHDAHHYALETESNHKHFHLGLAIELLKYHLWDNLRSQRRCSASMHRSAINDTKKPHRYFSEELESAVGRSLIKEDRDVHEIVKEIWIARGLISHGKAAEFEARFPKNKQEKLRTSVSSLYKLSSFVSAVVRDAN